ncbi:mitochondrial import inner membrane translocase subunit tim-54 [Ophiostoma piceae UAMH 11346]|uniref:Mitochondrial import inner membrane translocase subunit TIM54 n=1 Tax=Ophiostoma piceae (strain UAMH 11346) TaxID=1262450 RepID=S3D6Q6_OPHP1|nr:mitochondrial import inner membrane translocase subunit tim-54 [Ophiostoma piceae UAMH 11346]
MSRQPTSAHPPFYTMAKPNPALRMLGLPNLPSKLPSRNWLIFWGVTTTFSAAIIYDRREKIRATQRWAAAVAPLAKQPLSDLNEMPRRITVYLEAPPGDGLRAAQDHFKEYIKPILSSSGLDWEFVVGRRQGDIRAAVAEHIRRQRRREEQAAQPVVEAVPAAAESALDASIDGEPNSTDPNAPNSTSPAPALAPVDPELALDADVIEDLRRRSGIEPYQGIKGDLVVGRTTWKEYVRGLHEGWLGPPRKPAELIEAEAAAAELEAKLKAESTTSEPPKAEPATPKRPPQPQPYNKVADYTTSAVPANMPETLGPAVAVQFPHLLGFLNTPIRLWRFLHRRRVADDIGREVAALCFATAQREFRSNEIETALDFEEKNWTKTVFEDDKDDNGNVINTTKEKIWPLAVTVDPRIGERMRRFEVDADAEAAARAIKVPEELIEGWTKGKFRQLGRWAWRKASGAGKFDVKLGSLEDN